MKNFSVCLGILILFFLIFPKTSLAQIVINEVLNNPAGDETGAEWVELFNLSNSPYSLSECVLLLDDSAPSQKVNFDNSDFIEKFKVISWDKSWLNNSGDKIRLECSGYTDSVSYGNSQAPVVDAPKEGVSFGRSPDGTGSFSILAKITIGEPNSSPPTSTPVPTNKPTATPKPAKTPTSEIAVQKTSTPIPVLITNKIESEVGSTDEEILGFEDQNDKFSNYINQEEIKGVAKVAGVTKESSKEVNSGKKAPLAASIFFIISGLLVLAFSAYPVIKSVFVRYNFKNDKEARKD